MGNRAIGGALWVGKSQDHQPPGFRPQPCCHLLWTLASHAPCLSFSTCKIQTVIVPTPLLKVAGRKDLEQCNGANGTFSRRDILREGLS